MQSIRDAVRKSVSRHGAEEVEEAPGDGERTLARLRAVLWPERDFEVKRERARAGVEAEARGE